MMLDIFVFPCSLPDASECGDLSKLKNKQVVNGVINKGFNPSNLKQPVNIVTEFDGIQNLDLGLHKRNIYKVRENEIWDQRRDFFESTLRMRYADYALDFIDHSLRDKNQKHCDFSLFIQPEQEECVPFVSYSFRASSEKRIIIRTYPMFFSSLGEIGGTAEIISLLFTLLYSWYNNYFLSKYVKHEVLDEKVKDEFKSLISGDEELQNVRIRNSNERSNKTKRGEISNVLKGREMGVKKGEEGEGEVRIEESELEDLLESTIEDSESGIRLFKALNDLDVLKTILLKPRHQTLIPVLTMHLKK